VQQSSVCYIASFQGCAALVTAQAQPCAPASAMVGQVFARHRQVYTQQAQSPWTAALDAWRLRAACRSRLQELCLAPERSVRVFDQATIALACTRVERSKSARDSVVLTKSNGKVVGRTAILLRRQMLLRWTGMPMQSQASAMACQSAWAAQCSRETLRMTVLAIYGH